MTILSINHIQVKNLRDPVFAIPFHENPTSKTWIWTRKMNPKTIQKLEEKPAKQKQAKETRKWRSTSWSEPHAKANEVKQRTVLSAVHPRIEKEKGQNRSRLKPKVRNTTNSCGHAGLQDGDRRRSRRLLLVKIIIVSLIMEMLKKDLGLAFFKARAFVCGAHPY